MFATNTTFSVLTAAWGYTVWTTGSQGLSGPPQVLPAIENTSVRVDELTWPVAGQVNMNETSSWLN